MLGAKLDWQGLDVAAAMVGEEDIESLVVRLVAIRDWQEANRD